MDEDKLEELKKKKMQDMQGGDVEGQMDAQKEQEEQMREQLKQIASQILTKEARSRLGNIRAAKPDLASQIELQLVQLYRMGQINGKLSDDELKKLLKSIKDSDDDRDIKYSRPR